ncbi:MAG: SufE family protein, partial [Gammaproteobacteria bacterium]
QRLAAAQGLRLSLAAYNTFADIERTIDVIRKWFEGALFYQKSFYQKRSHQPECSSVYDVVDDLDINALRAKQDWQSRYRMLMAWGNVIQPKPALRALATQRVAGCEAETWLAVTLDQGRYWFSLDSSSRLVRGLGALMLLWFQGHTAEEIAAVDLEGWLRELGLEQYLSATRASGFRALVTAALQAVSPELDTGGEGAEGRDVEKK